MSLFTLHERLAADTSLVCELPLSSCLLMNDARYPWLILVPRLAELRDLHEVPAEHRAALFEEIDQASRALVKLSTCVQDKRGGPGQSGTTTAYSCDCTSAE